MGNVQMSLEKKNSMLAYHSYYTDLCNYVIALYGKCSNVAGRWELYATLTYIPLYEIKYQYPRAGATLDLIGSRHRPYF